jgi:phosphopantothenoylcysteine decarboxylase/phosphopantothenate--cysteine ligase
MKCIVTAGPTYEPLDEVRRLTNFSTGRLGTELAGFLAQRGYDVTLLIGQQATYRDARKARQVQTFTTTADLAERMRALAEGGADAVFHAAAVSDFTFGKVWVRDAGGELREIQSGKLSTRDGTLLAELLPTPKLIARMREWFPTATVVGWKYEVEGDRESVIRAATKQINECSTDACIVNGPAWGIGFGLVRVGAETVALRDKERLFERLAGLLYRKTV